MSKTQMIALAAITSTFAWTLASPAAAQSSFAEVQIDAAPLATYFRSTLIREVSDLCPEPVSSVLCGGERCYLDHIDVPQGGTFRWGPGVEVAIDERLPRLRTEQLQFVQPITVFTKTEACVMDVDCPRDEYARRMTLHVVSNMSATRDEICVTPVGFDEMIPQDLLPDAIAEVCVPLQLRAVDALVEGSLTQAGVAIGGNADASRIAVRVEYLPSNFDALSPLVRQAVNSTRRAVWQGFLGHAISSAAGLQDGFGVLMTAGLIEQAVSGRMRSAIADAPGTTLLEGPSSTFSWYLGPDGYVGTSLYVDQDVPVCPNDFGVEVDVSMPISFANGELVLDGLLRWNVIDSDVITCAVLPTTPGTPALLAFIAAIAASEYVPDTTAFQQSTCDVGEVDDGISMRCTTAVEDIVEGTANNYLALRFQEATPSAAGVTLHGSATAGVVVLEDASRLGVGGSLTYGIHGNVCRGGWVGYAGEVRTTRGRICDVAIVNDRHGVYRAHDITEYHAKIEFPTLSSQLCETSPGSGQYQVCPTGALSPLDRFWSDPYGAEVVVFTTRGAIGIRLDEPRQPTAEEEDLIDTRWAAERAALCHELQTGLFGIPGLYDWRWDVDPPDFRVKTVIDGRVRDVGSVVLADVRLREARTMTRLGAIRTSRVPMVLDAVAVVDTGRSGVHRVAISVPLSVDFRVESDGRQVRALSSRTTVSTRVTFDRSAPEAIRGASFDLALPPGAIAIAPAR